ncbi:MAG: GNAT family N-acetyltransferase [Rehaibacterium terrae]|uniref:GNAT family N-acetyltransferase n=1 Tax=Rehaibacterium terrae TaxID=1341696 RepID=UPI0039194B63
MDFLSSQGALALGSRFKALSERLYDAADAVYRAQGSAMQARWLPLLKLLLERGPMPVGDIAREIGQSHSAVSQLATRLAREGWLSARGDRKDRRRRMLALTPKAEAELKALRPLWRAVRETVDETIAATGHDLLAALAAFERRLDAAPIHEAILARHQAAARRALRVVPFDPALREHFYRLNAEWLQKYFYLEQVDHEVLSNPEQRIIAPGGEILFALLDEEVVGTCALLQESPGVFELTKMAVTERHQGLGIGRRLLAAAIEAFRRRGGRELFLESNSRLQPALRLYASMGFQMQPSPRPGSHYQRADVYMIWRDPEAARAA